MAGTLVTVGVLIELLGFSGTLAFGAVLNFIVALLSAELGFRTVSEVKTPPSKAAKKAVKENPQPSLGPGALFPLAILFLTGFGSMAMEVVWTRNFTPILKTQVYSFGMILFTYLAATWLGSLFYRKALEVGKVFSNETLLAYLALSSLFPVVLTDPRYNQSIPLVLLTLVPFCAVLGYLTPKLIDDISAGQPKNAGKAYAVNVVGCILGPLIASYIFLPWLGAKSSLVLLALPFLAVTFVGLKTVNFRRLIPQGLALAFGAVAIGYSQSYELSHVGEVRRDYMATVISDGVGMGKELFVNGYGMTSLLRTTKYMAHLPLSLLKHKPEKVLDICFGMGTTYRSLMSWNIQVTAAELCQSVRDAFPYYFDDAAEILKRPNGKIVVDDGRRYLKRTGDLFDLITIDPPPPEEAAGSSLLYSKQFFSLIKMRLKKGGLLQEWYPNSTVDPKTGDAVTRSIVESFPYVKIFPGADGFGFYFICSMEPIEIPSEEEMISRIPPSAQKDLMEWAPQGVSILDYVKPIFTGGSDVRLTDMNPGIVITDDTPFNEYFYLRRTFPKYFWQ